MIRESFLRFLYEAASMQRWNDHIRPHKGFSELDKQAHKLFYAYVIGRLEEDSGCSIDWNMLIEGALFEFFRRILLTDIKPPVFHNLMEKKGAQINTHVMEKLADKGLYELGGADRQDEIYQRMRSYFFDSGYCSHEKRILKAAHYFATNWEFDIVYRLSTGFFGLDDTKRNIESQLEEHYDMPGVQGLLLKRKIRDFMNLIGQLRFQQRWSQTPRIPETSVAGHMLVVAVLSWALSLETEACSKRIRNNFFAGLYHDLPEVLTRDIISPVKSSIDGLGDLIKEIEDNQLKEIVYPLLPPSWCKEIYYFTDNEFRSKIFIGDECRLVSSKDINENYNSEEYNPIDGEIVEFCDKFSAYMEAYLSLKHGISSTNLVEGLGSIKARYSKATVAGYNAGHLFDYFKQ